MTINQQCFILSPSPNSATIFCQEAKNQAELSSPQGARISSCNTDIMIFAARACLGTPFHHQGRSPKAGLDCIGLVVTAMRAAAMAVRDRLDYGVRPDGQSLVAALHEHGAREVSVIQGGDILLFRYDNQPQHVALATSPDTMIHAFAPAGCVVETTIGSYWRRRLVGVYRV